MLNRIFKTILVLSICVGISLPTNAAVSVSDGSAFVTKAEFAADLNNLSNRMAQLENSLDAKIDSLVSSYLTRNGIWNGARQTLNYVEACMGGQTTADGININNWMSWFGADRWKKSINYNSNSFRLGVYNGTNFCIIDVLSKSGMLMGVYDFNLADPVSGYDQLLKMDPLGIIGGVQNSGSWEKSLQCYLSWYEKDATQYRLLDRKLIYDLQFANTAYQSTVKDIEFFPITGVLLCFVSKGNSLFLRPEWIMNGKAPANYLEFKTASNRKSNSFAWKFVPQDFSIY